MTASLLLAIDVGMTNVKAVAFDATGELVSRASVGYSTERPSVDAAEQDPASWWDAVVQAIRRIPEGIRRDVAAIGVTGHMHALVVLDHAGSSLRPSMILGDRRAASDAIVITQRLGEARVYAVTGAELDASMPAAKTRFLARTEPELWGRVSHVLGCKDYLRYRLTGEIATEPVDACATSLFDIVRGTWSDELMDAASVGRTMLPEVRSPTDRAGGLLSSVAAVLGLPTGIPVAIGAGDDVVVLGFGLLDPGVALEHIGTTGSIMAVTHRPTPDPERKIELYPHVIPDRWVVGGSHTTAGAAIAWAADLLGYPSVEASLAAIESPRVRGLSFVPALAGERFPERIPSARGAWVRLSLDMTRESLMRSVFDGVAASLRAVLERIDEIAGHQTSVRVSRADHQPWLELRAAAYGRPIEVSRTPEPTALGLATVMAVTAGLHADVESAVTAMTRVERTVAAPAVRERGPDAEALLRAAWAPAAAARSALREDAGPTEGTRVRGSLVDSGAVS